MIYFLLLLCPFWAVYADLSLEEKIGQLLLVHFNGTCANEDSAALLTQAHVGGLIYYTWANELSSPAQVKELSASLQKQNPSRVPLLIAVDQEGGRVNRLTQGFTLFPSQEARGKMNNEKQVAETIGNELASVGITMNFAPVVDVRNSHSKIILWGDRSYGSDPVLVTALAKAALEGYKNGNILAVLKHFPGQGDVSIDSHEATPSVNKSLKDLEKTDLFPFRQLCPFADAIMTAHILVPALDPEMPATFSKPILEDLLRNKWGFNGVVISDSLVMKGASLFPSHDKAALHALLAGCDLLCLGGKLLNIPSQDELKVQDVVKIHAYLTSAARQGKISMSAIDAKVQRILQLKFLSEIRRALTPEKMQAIAKKIWQNECKGTLEGLVTWNAGENFMSLGIGHFIWFPEGEEAVFDAGFPQYLAFLKRKNHKIPEEFAEFKHAPWPSKEEFLLRKQEAAPLRKWLSETIDLQTSFIIERFFTRFRKIIEAQDPQKREALLFTLQKIAASEKGIFALIDYLNFKGDGLSPKERYQGKGWGLAQVLLAMPLETKTPLEDFQRVAIEALEERVKNSAPERGESRFLAGWKNRIWRYSIL
jgi:beta-glucosidase-like glycosyl hydrolase